MHLLTGKENYKYTLFGFVGRLNIDKGIDELLRAFYLHNKKSGKDLTNPLRIFNNKFEI